VQNKVTKQRRITLEKLTPFKGSRVDMMFMNMVAKQNLIDHFSNDEERKVQRKELMFDTQFWRSAGMF
jgi:hypothetical protein